LTGYKEIPEEELRHQREVEKQAAGLRKLAEKITAPESYTEEIDAEIDQFAELDGKLLKSVVKQLNIDAKGSGKKLILEVLGQLSGCKPETKKKEKSAKKEQDNLRFDQLLQEVMALAARDGTDNLPTAQEVDDVVGQLRMDLKPPQIKKIAKKLTKESDDEVEENLRLIRAFLTRTNRQVESQSI
jgi:TRAP-type uncharacterized transport system substrate-binding protein